MAQDAFDLAEQFQTPVFVMMDLDLGMNNWMSERFAYPTKPINRGKLLTAHKLKALGEWGAIRTSTAMAFRTGRFPAMACRRLLHVDRGITPRGSTANGPTITWPTSIASRASLRRRARPSPGPSSNTLAGASIGVVGFGTSHWAIVESRTSCSRRPPSRPRTCGCAPTPSTTISPSSSTTMRAST